MRVGQTSLVVFLAKILSSILGFVATVYFARVLGPEVYGIYAIVIAVVAWLKLFGNLGITKAVKKRVSEGSEPGKYLSAGAIWLFAFAVTLSFVIVFFQSTFEAYIDGWNEYVAISVIWFILGLLLVRLCAAFVNHTLEGDNLVHIAGLLDPVKIGLRSATQILLVFLGFHLVGMMVGYILGVAVAVLIALTFVRIRPELPSFYHLRSIFDYAKYSWFGGLRGRSYQDVDILILALLVPTSLVGIYAIAWSFILVLKLFGEAVSRAMFPEISRIAATEGLDATAGYVEDAIAYGGLIAIPGAVGGTLLADRLLRIHGPAYTEGTAVLWLMLLGVVFFAYMRQCLNALNALDRPDLAFWANVLFVATNVVLNLVLIMEFGWVGAAIASAWSTALGLVTAYILLSRLLEFSFPVKTISRQLVAAVLMAVPIVLLDGLFRSTALLPHEIAGLIVLVPLGAFIYFGSLLWLSVNFREMVVRNLPYDVSVLH